MSITSPDRNTSSSRRVSPNGGGHNNRAKKKRRSGGKPKQKRHAEGIKTGRWTDEESTAFLLGMKKHGPGKWSMIGLNIPTRDTMQVKTHGQTILKRMRKGENVFELLVDENGMNSDHMSSSSGGDYDFTTTATKKSKQVETEADSVLSSNNRSISTECTPLPMNTIDQNSRTKDYLYSSAHPLTHDNARPPINEDSMKGTRNEHPATTQSLDAHNSHNDEYIMSSSQHQHDSYEYAHTTHSQHRGYTCSISQSIENAALHQQGLEQTPHSQPQRVASASDSASGALATNAVDDAIIHMGHNVDFLESIDFDFQNSSNGHRTSNDSSNLHHDPLVDPIEFDSPDASINLVEYNEWADDLADISIHFPTSDADFEAATAAHADSAAALFHDAIFHQRVSP
uniref:HTH myb-type domain-containing protein n=1 Tax=Chaetoceros debilis TaxID=122233 RepID=A0A7S3Q499_9STRA|mmetsp:Transcript_522/g.838  ORF Transcript_522/g.838 Transcript_522/m.838 type:complete len:399 (-) Transcript_522:12-1208(-)